VTREEKLADLAMRVSAAATDALGHLVGEELGQVAGFVLQMAVGAGDGNCFPVVIHYAPNKDVEAIMADPEFFDGVRHVLDPGAAIAPPLQE
jgi:hypothetical protein